jgi:hypothetical protein
MTNPPQKPQKPRSAAQRASDANKIQQYAVRTNTARPGDRRPGQPQLQNDHQTGQPAAGRTGAGDKQ